VDASPRAAAALRRAAGNRLAEGEGVTEPKKTAAARIRAPWSVSLL